MARLGQHFLRDAGVLRKIADAARADPGELIVEVGAGHGELTAVLLERYPAGTLVAVEKDPRLAGGLRRRFEENRRLIVLEGDARRILPVALEEHARRRSYVLVGNIPYYLTGYLLRIVGELRRRPRRAVFLVQQEVAERAAAAAPRMNRLAAIVQFWASAEVGARVPRRDFDPPPKVDSAALVLESRASALLEALDPARYAAAVRAIFAQPRKTAENNLASALGSRSRAAAVLHSARVPEGARPQDLSVSQIAKITLLFPRR